MVAEKKKKYYDSKNDYYNSNITRPVLLEQMIAHNEENKLMDDTRLIDEVFTVLAAVTRYKLLNKLFFRFC